MMKDRIGNKAKRTGMRDVSSMIDKMKNASNKRAITKNTSVIDGQLVMWPEKERRMPNELIRSSLFTARGKKVQRSFFSEYVELYVYGNATIQYRGDELRALDDEPVWLQICHLFRQVNISTDYVEFTTADLLSELGWAKNGAYYKKLSECIDRLDSTMVKLTTIRNKVEYKHTFSLIRKHKKIDKGAKARWRVYLEPEVINLFKGVHYTKIEWENWKKLKPIAKRLDGWIRSHKNPIPVSLDAIRGFLGSDNKNNDSLKQKINEAMKEIQSLDMGVSDFYWDDRRKLCVVRDLSQTHEHQFIELDSENEIEPHDKSKEDSRQFDLLV